MSRARVRPWYRLDVYAALDRLRSLFASLFARATLGHSDGKPRRTSLELVPLDWRSPCSESLGAVVLPLAVTGAGLAAGVYLVGALDAADAQARASAGAEVAAEQSAVGSPTEPPAVLGGVGPAAPADDPHVTGVAEPAGLVAASTESPSDAEVDAGTEVTAAGPAGGWGGDFVDALGNRFDIGAGGVDPGFRAGAGGPSALVPSVGGDPGDPGDGLAGGGVPQTTKLLSANNPGVLADPGGSTGVVSPRAARGHAVAVAASAAGLNNQQQPGPASVPRNLADQPVRFVANAGQWDPAVDFAVRAGGYQAWLADGDLVLALPRPAGADAGTAARDLPADDSPAGAADVVRMLWGGIDPDARVVGQGRLGSVSNYLIGDDPALWRTNVAEYSGVRYTDAWDGIDLVYHQTAGGELEYDLVVRPGAAAGSAGFRVEGADARVEGGTLILTTPGGAELVQQAPVLYQTRADGTRRGVAGSYALRADGSVGFSVGAYDPTRRLVIDPVLSFTATPGGSDYDVATGVAADAAGNAYVVGYTASGDFPYLDGFDATLSGYQDAFVAKYDALGNLVRSTYLGGSDSDAAGGMALGAGGVVYLTGSTESADFPTTPGVVQPSPAGTPSGFSGTYPYEAYVAEVSADGTALVYATYLGGSANDTGYGVAVDPASGQAVVVGTTSSSDFPATGGAAQGSSGGGSDAFVARLSAGGTALVYATYLGGSSSEIAYGVAIDGAGDAVVTGMTRSTNFPTTQAYDATYGGGFTDAFLARYTAGGSLEQATYYGGADVDVGRGVALDAQDRVYVTGHTASTDLPTVAPVQGSHGGGVQDAFVARFDSLSMPPAYATYQGGSDTDYGLGVAVDFTGRAVVVGTSGSNLTATRYAAAGSSVDWSASAAGGGNAAAVDPSGNVYAAGADGSGNALVLKYVLPAAPAVTGVTTDSGASNSDRVTNDTTPTLSGTAPAGSTVTVYRRGPGDPGPVAVGTPAVAGGLWTFTYSPALADGVYAFTARATLSGESSPASAPVTVTVDAAPASLALSVGTESLSTAAYDVQTTDLAPDVTVAVADLVGLAAAGTVALDVDLDYDGTFTDPGESGYALATVTNGVAVVADYTPLTPNTTVGYRVRGFDLAGNEGVSAVATVAFLAATAAWVPADVTADDRSGYGGLWDWTTPEDELVFAGDVAEQVPLATYSNATDCGCQAPYLEYNSLEAAPAPTVQALVPSDNALGVPDHVYGTLTWDGVAGSTIDYDLSALSPGGLWAFAAAPGGSPSTARHTYTLALFVDYAGTSNDRLLTVTGDTFAVDRSAGPYGAGWTFSNTDALVPVPASGPHPAGLLRVFGKGGWAFYEDAGGGGYAEPAGDPGTLTSAGGGWTYTSADGKVLRFDSSGRMTEWTPAGGSGTVTYAYDGAGAGTAARVATVTRPDGGVATFTYSGGLLATVTAPGNRVTTLTYAGGDLTQVTDPAGGARTFAYSAHRLAGTTHGAATKSFTYSNGLAATRQLGSDAAAAVSPAAGQGLAAAGQARGGGVRGSFTDGRGGTTSRWYNPLGLPVRTEGPDGAVRTVERDANGHVTRSTDPLGRVTEYVVDAAGRVLDERRADGTAAFRNYGGANGSLTNYLDYRGGLWTFTNDAAGRRLTATDPLNHTTTYTWAGGRLQTVTDPLGNVVTYHYDASGRPDGMLLGGAVTGTVGYDAAGNAVTFTDALGNVTTTTYDGMGRPLTVTDALGNVTTSAYDAGGYLRSVTDPLGRVTSYAYDAAGRVAAVVGAHGTGLAQRTTFVYDAASNRVAAVDPLGNRTTGVYDLAGRLVATIDPLGNRATHSYDLAGQLVATTDPLGRVTRYGYNDLGRRVTVTDPLGRVATTVYDGNSNVVAAVDPLGNRTTSVFDAADRMTASVDPLGNRTTTAYDAVGRAVTTTDPLLRVSTTVYDARSRVSATVNALGHRVTFGYDAADNQVSVTDPLNHTATTVYDATNRAVASVDALGNRSTAVYDAAGQAVASVDPLGNRTTTVYDELGRRAATVDALNNRNTSVYDAASRVIAAVAPNGNRTTSVYDAASRVVATVDALGNRATSVYDDAGQVVAAIDALGNRTSYGYDAAGRQVATTDPLGNVWTAGYDAAGRAVTSTDPLGRTTTTVFDNASRVIATVDPLGNRTSYGYDAASNAVIVTDARGNVTTGVYDELNRRVATVDALTNRTTTVFDAAGRLIATVDPLNRRTTTGYDAADRAVTTTDPLGNVWTTAYDAAGNATASTDPLNHTTTTVYDILNRPVAVVDALGNRTSSSYDAAGNLRTVTDARTNVTTYGYDARNLRVATTDALGNVWTAQYDALGRAWRSVDPLGRDTRTYFDAAGRAVEAADALGNRTRAVYDAAGNAVAAVDPLGHRTTYGYDAADRLVTIKDALNGVTTFTYDQVGNRRSLTDPVNNTTTWVYDAVNRVTTETDPTNTSSTFAYDAAGQLTSKTDRLGRRVDFGYEGVGRTASEAWLTAGATVQLQTWTYDAAGRVLTSQDPDGVYTLAYDAADRVTQVEEPFGLVLTMGYDAANNRTGVQDSKGGRTTVTFDALNRQSGEELGGTVVTGVKEARTYTAAGELSLKTRQTWTGSAWATAGTTSYAYDADARVARITHLTGGGSVLASYVYDYDAAGRLTAETVNGTQRTYAYDATGQLTGDAGTAYNYDANGNRNTAGYTTGAANRTTTDGMWTYTYDAEGNVTKRSKGASSETWVYTYDHRNQMLTAASSATDGGAVTGRVTYAYDAPGNRVERGAWDGTTATTERFGVDGWDPAKPPAVGTENFDTWADLDGSNALTARRNFGPGFDELTVREDSSGTVGWYLTDHLGNVRGVTNGSGTPLTTITYDGWGKVLSNSAPAQSDRYLYTGREWDTALGLQYSRARLYDAASGKWFAEDLIGFGAGDLNLRRYNGNSPTNLTDPSGLQHVHSNQQPVPITLSADDTIPTIPKGPNQQFVWSTQWYLTTQNKDLVIQKGFVVQFVKINFDLHWFNGETKTTKATVAEIFQKAGQNLTNVTNPGWYIEHWPVKGISTNVTGVCEIKKDNKSTFLDVIYSSVNGESGAIITEDNEPSSVIPGRTINDTFGGVIQNLQNAAGNTVIKGTIGIEGIAFYINNAPIKWDGVSSLGKLPDGRPGPPIEWGSTPPKLLLNRLHFGTGAGMLLAVPGGAKNIAKTWSAQYNFNWLTLAQQVDSKDKAIPQTQSSSGVWRKIVVGVDTSKSPSATLLYSKTMAVHAADMPFFMQQFSDLPLGYTAAPGSVASLTAFSKLSTANKISALMSNLDGQLAGSLKKAFPALSSTISGIHSLIRL